MSRPWRQQVKPRTTPDDDAGRYSEFEGVVNTRSRKDIGLKALFAGDNVTITDTKKIKRRNGYALARTATGTVQSVFGGTGTPYIVDNGTLIHIVNGQERTLLTGLTGTDYHWDVINGDVYFANGVEAGICRGDTYLPWRLTIPPTPLVEFMNAATVTVPLNAVGTTYTSATFRVTCTYVTVDGRETAPCDNAPIVCSPLTNLLRVTVTPPPAGYATVNVYVTEPDGVSFRLAATSSTGGALTINPQRTGEELTTYGMQSLPAGVNWIAQVRGYVWASVYNAQTDQSCVYMSDALGYHLFDTSNDFRMFPGQMSALLWLTPNENPPSMGVLISTTQYTYHYHIDEDQLDELVDYGAIPGTAAVITSDSTGYWFTPRGLCRGFPFENLTEKNYYPLQGTVATGAYAYLNGEEHFIAVIQNGQPPFNQRTERS